MLRQVFCVLGVWSLLIAAPLSVAGAADMSMPLKAPYAPPPAASWTGCYLDGGFGYGMSNINTYGETFPGLVPLTTGNDSGGEGWLARLGGGCDYQFPLGGLGNFVLGAFGDYDFMNLKSNMADVSGLGGPERESGAWYAGGRLGFLVTPSLLVYTDGGYTQTRFDAATVSSTVLAVPSPAFLLPAQTYSGWFLGGGTEYALSMSWVPIRGLFWRNEYRYAQYQSADLPISLATTGVVTAAEHTSNNVQTITSSLVWRFNWGGR